MLIIQIELLAGRYHATPWGRNVNEGDVEWPPSSYRLARALVDVWKRRKPHWEESRIILLLEALSGTPRYLLPRASSAHTRSYLSANEKDPTAKQLIFDSFVVSEKGAKILAGFESELSTNSADDLNELLSELSFLGRSESWVRAGVVKEQQSIEWNCYPDTFGGAGSEYESVQVACLLPTGDYAHLPYRPERLGWNGKKLVRTGKACSWIEAVSLTTKRLLDEGWSDPPALAWTTYNRAVNALRSFPTPKTTKRVEVKCAKYALVSRVLPQLQETASLAERIRTHLMGIHKRMQGGDPTLVSAKFSGKTPGGKPLSGHKHAFYVPLDEDGDGRLDHLMVYAGDPFEPDELKAVDSLRSVWQPNGLPDLKLVLVSMSHENPGGWSTRWASATPFVTARHYRKGRGPYDEWLKKEILRECRHHGLPEPVDVEWISSTVNTRRPVRWFEFQRCRRGEVPLSGYGCVLTFGEPVFGPFVLGSGCHYGLGLFMPFT
ncbi:MAG TPA: type I-U CRISPR-associated protein Csb2 [Syntrophobacteraceae bacterium]|nr:type I-U CRISPR-associated protein Csb2 [Syntrophobacteraceae bacterium]